MTTAIVLALLTAGQPATVSGKGIGIGDDDLAGLRACGLAIVVPTYVPKGLKLVSWEATREGIPQLSYVSLRWQDKSGKSWFELQGASEGLGDPFFTVAGGDVLDATGTIKGTSPLFGKFDLEYVESQKYKMFHTTWYEYKTRSFPVLWLINGERIAPKEAAKVFASLRVLKPAP